MAKIKLTQGKEAIVDDGDYPSLSKLRWYYSHGYATRKSPKTCYMHRYILGVTTSQMVDHINGDKLDNRRSNLRVCSSLQNGANRRVQNKNNTSGYRGVFYNKKNRNWFVTLRIEGKSRYFGSFSSPIEAAKKYDAVAKDYYGEFVTLNNV